MKQKNRKYLTGLCLIFLLLGLVSATDSQSSSSSSSSVASTTSSSSSSSTSSSESSSSSTSSSIYASTSSSQVSSSSSSSSSAPTTTLTWMNSVNSTIDWLVSIMPKFGNLISGVGNSLIWPIVYVLIIIAIGGLVLTFVSAIAGLATMMLHAFKAQTKGFGKRK